MSSSSLYFLSCDRAVNLGLSSPLTDKANATSWNGPTMDTHPKPCPRLDWSSPPIISALNFSTASVALPCFSLYCYHPWDPEAFSRSCLSQRLHTPLPAFQNHCLLSMESSKFAFDSFFKDRISWTPDWSWTHYVAEDDLELLISLPYLSNTEVIGMCYNVRDTAQGFVQAR